MIINICKLDLVHIDHINNDSTLVANDFTIGKMLMVIGYDMKDPAKWMILTLLGTMVS